MTLIMAYFESGVFWKWRILKVAYFESDVFWKWRILKVTRKNIPWYENFKECHFRDSNPKPRALRPNALATELGWLKSIGILCSEAFSSPLGFRGSLTQRSRGAAGFWSVARPRIPCSYYFTIQLTTATAHNIYTAYLLFFLSTVKHRTMLDGPPGQRPTSSGILPFPPAVKLGCNTWHHLY